MNLNRLRKLADLYGWKEETMKDLYLHRFKKNKTILDVYISKYEGNGTTLCIHENGKSEYIRNISDENIKKKLQVCGFLKEEDHFKNDEVIIKKEKKPLTLKTRLWFGAYKGKTIEQVLDIKPTYVTIWMVDQKFNLSKEILSRRPKF